VFALLAYTRTPRQGVAAIGAVLLQHLLACKCFGRYRGLGKVESHLTGGPPRRYQNKDNLHAKRSAKQLPLWQGWAKLKDFWMCQSPLYARIQEGNRAKLPT
jgi:hypothetical protein